MNVSVMKGPETTRLDELSKQYRWRAENNIRFFEGLGMTTEEKVDFLAKEFAGIQMYFEANNKFPKFGLDCDPRSKQR